MLACYSFDDLMNLIFLFNIPKCEYLCSIIENLLGADDLRRPPSQAKIHILNLGRHIDLTKKDGLLPMNLHEA